MEKELRDLLANIIKQEEARKEVIENAKNDIENSKKRERMSLERLEDKLKEDQRAGVLDFTDGQIDREIEKGKAKISQDYQVERNELEARLLELEQTEENTDSNNRKIILALRKYRDEMMQEQYKVQKEIKNHEDKLNILEEQKMQELDELDKQIREKDAKYTHLIMRNRNAINIQNNDTRDINLISKELEELKLQKGDIITKYQAQLDTIENEEQELKNQVKDFEDKIENVNQFFGKIEVKDKTPKEIYEILFGEEQPVEEVEQEQQPEEIIEEPVVEEVEEEQQPEQVIEEPKVEPVVIVQPASEVVKKEQPVEVVEEKKPEEVVQEKETVQVVEKVQPANGVKINNLQNQEKQPSRQPVIKQTKTPDQDRNYKYFENNKDIIIKYFMKATGIKKNEATEIFSNKEHCEAVGEMCRMWMHQQNRDNNELYKKMENFYWGIDSKLDIEVSNNGIKYNQELMSPIEITDFEEYEEEFIEEIINKYEQDLSGYKYASKDIVYDRNIIIAIAMDNCKEDADRKLQLTTSGMKKMAEYLDLIVNPVNKKGSVTYNLEKMSMFRGLINISSWTPKKVGEFRKIAYQAKDTYAQIIPDRITKMKWAIKDWFKGVTTKKLTKGEQTVSKAETVKENEEKRNKWELPFEQKAYANSRTEKTQNVEQPKSEKSAENEIQI